MIALAKLAGISTRFHKRVVVALGKLGRTSSRGLRATASFATLLAALAWTGCQRSSDIPEPAALPVVDVAQTRAAAEQGQPDAQKLLGDLYAAGRGVTQDFRQALAWYTKAAGQGNAGAQNSLGELIEAGQGGKPSYTDAAEWYRKAAEKGSASAEYNLAVLYTFGRGVKMNEKEAVQWYQKAANHGHALAQFNLGQRYRLGQGVEKDLAEAFKWLSLAAKEVADSGKLRDEVKSELSRDQLAEGRRRIEAFKVHEPSPTPKL